MNQGRCDALALTLGGADGGVRGRPALGEHLVQRLRAPASHHCIVAEWQRKIPCRSRARRATRPRRDDSHPVGCAVLKQAEHGARQVVLHRPRELVAHLGQRQRMRTRPVIARHQVRDALDKFALNRNVQRVHAVSVGGVDVGLAGHEVVDELNVATRERVVQRCAPAAMLPVVGVRALGHEDLGNDQPRLLAVCRLAVADGDLVQAAVELALRRTCQHGVENQVCSRMLAERGAMRAFKTRAPFATSTPTLCTSRRCTARMRGVSTFSSGTMQARKGFPVFHSWLPLGLLAPPRAVQPLLALHTEDPSVEVSPCRVNVECWLSPSRNFAISTNLRKKWQSSLVSSRSCARQHRPSARPNARLTASMDGSLLALRRVAPCICLVCHRPRTER